MSDDPFDLLELEARFDLSRDEIEKRYLARVRSLHPDAAPDDPAAPALAAALNDARAALLNPERRAAALMARLGAPPPEKDKSLPPEFLAEIMDVREAADAAVASRDPAQIRLWHDWAVKRRAQIIESVASSFAALPRPAPVPALAAVRRSLNAWRYIERLIDQLAEPAR